MLLVCQICREFTSRAGVPPGCPNCRQGYGPTGEPVSIAAGRGAASALVPKDPTAYERFWYTPGFIGRFLPFLGSGRRKAVEQKRDEVLSHYRALQTPYFRNFVLRYGPWHEPDEDPVSLFRHLLLRRGMASALGDWPLVNSLLLSTYSNQEYEVRESRLGHLSSESRQEFLQQFVESFGGLFKDELPFVLEYFRRSRPDWLPRPPGARKPRAGAVPGAAVQRVPLEDPIEASLRAECEKLYFELRLETFERNLLAFSEEKYVRLEQLDYMDGDEFETFLALLFRSLGFDVEAVGGRGDQGADLFLHRYGEKRVVQAKRSIDPVGNSAVQEVIAAREMFACDSASVVTNNYFTSSAKDLAAAGRVELVDRRRLAEYLESFNARRQAAAEETASESTPAAADERPNPSTDDGSARTSDSVD